jgi:IS5 family transposase
MQLTFGEAGGFGHCKKPRRDLFVDEMVHVAPWNRLLALIEPHYPVSG